MKICLIVLAAVSLAKASITASVLEFSQPVDINGIEQSNFRIKRDLTVQKIDPVKTNSTNKPDTKSRKEQQKLDVEEYIHDAYETLKDPVVSTEPTTTVQDVKKSTAQLNVTENNTRRLLASHIDFENRGDNEIRQKLLDFIQETLVELDNKMAALKPIKDYYQNDVNYKIGYVIANIDNMNVNLKNLKNDLDLNKRSWEDRKISHVFDSVKTSNKAMQTLLDALNIYTGTSLERKFN